MSGARLASAKLKNIGIKRDEEKAMKRESSAYDILDRLFGTGSVPFTPILFDEFELNTRIQNCGDIRILESVVHKMRA